MTIALLILAWCVAGLPGLGWNLANAKARWGPAFWEQEYRQQLGFYLVYVFLFGPIFSFLSYFMTGFAEHGWRLRR